MRFCFILEEKSFPRQGYSIYSDDKVIGEVTSGTYSPNLDKFIGMGYVDKEHAKINNFIEIKIRNKFHKAKIVSYQFVKTGVKRNSNEDLTYGAKRS